jgi:hypothetical protein
MAEIGLTVPERTERVVADDVEVKILGACSHPSPLNDRLARSAIHYVGKADRVPLDDRMSKIGEYCDDLSRAQRSSSRARAIISSSTPSSFDAAS